ncbi:MAG: YjjG family noncanonical pyrimidine nucleotidase [Oscillospiraceae bacterium]|nr:YjjG family noncanonical pyrimidine nucleotidase [Oscillospiraceae bacterium]
MAEKQKWSIFLDLDNTILDFTWAEKRALFQTLSELGIEPTEEIRRRYVAWNIYCWEQLEEGKMEREEVLVRRFELLFEEIGVQRDAFAARRRYEGLLHEGHRFVPGAEELLRTLSPVHDLYLASNGVASVQHSRIASAGIEPYFKGIFISEELDAVKPQKEFFEACFARIPGFDPARALMVGDSLTSDIRGGINAGIKTCWLNYNNKPGREDIVPDYVIHAITELPALIDSL